MTSHVATTDPAQVQQALAEIRSLQDRLAQRIAHLEGQAPAALPGHWTAPALQWPARQSCWLRPATGTQLTEGLRYYAAAPGGWVQVIQQPAGRLAAAAQWITLNWAEAEGEWCSLVFDLRSLLQGCPPGRARLEVQAEAAICAPSSPFLKCAWKGASGRANHRTAEVRDQQPLALLIDHEDFEPAKLSSLDLHLVVKPAGRGSCTLRRLTARLLPLTEAATGPASDLFESPE
jgi:hypothetical protein